MLAWMGLPELSWHLVLLVRRARRCLCLPAHPPAHPPLAQMSLCLYVGNAMKDLVCSPRPLAVAYGRQRLKLLGEGGEEAELNAKVGGAGGRAGKAGGRGPPPTLPTCPRPPPPPAPLRSMACPLPTP